jgi:hypothetical protein
MAMARTLKWTHHGDDNADWINACAFVNRGREVKHFLNMVLSIAHEQASYPMSAYSVLH